MAASAVLVSPASGDESKVPELLATMIVTTILALIVVGTRLFVRLTVVHNVGWDDFLILIAAAFAIVTLIFETLAVQHGWGRHMYYVSNEDLIIAGKWTSLAIIPNLWSLMFARVSLCVIFLRIVDKLRIYQVFLWSMIILTVVPNLATSILLLIMCRPMEKLWNQNISGSCFPSQARYIVAMFQAVATILSDWLLAFFPVLVLQSLNMARKTKYALTVIMGLGIFVGICALVKTVMLNQLTSKPDATWDSLDLNLWAIIEQNVGLIAVSVPGIRPLFSRFFGMGSHNSKTNRRYIPDYGFDLGNMSGDSRGMALSSATVSVGDQKLQRGENGENSSESSLVGRRSDREIIRTLSFSVHGHSQDHHSRIERHDGKESEVPKQSWDSV